MDCVTLICAHLKSRDRWTGRSLRAGIAVFCCLLVPGLVPAGMLWGQAPGSAAPETAVPAGDKGLNTPLPRVSGAAPQPADSKLDTTGVVAGTDSSTEGSPVSPERAGVTIAIGTTLSVQVSQAVSSGMVKNGDPVHAVLVGPVKTSSGRTLAAGTRVDGTVVSAAKAGAVESGGILSLQVTRVGGIFVVSDVDEFNGKEGHKDLADAAPAKGEEAQVAAGAVLEFHVMQDGAVPGLVAHPSLTEINGGATVGSPAGAQPAAGTANTQPGANQTPAGGATQGVTPANVPTAPASGRPR